MSSILFTFGGRVAAGMGIDVTVRGRDVAGADGKGQAKRGGPKAILIAHSLGNLGRE